MGIILSIVRNRNSILVLAVILGLVYGYYAHSVSWLNVFALGLSMTFAMTALPFDSLRPFRSVVAPLAYGAFLNYILFGLVVIGLAYLLMPNQSLYYGFVVVAATPPGVAIIPFASILKGDIRYAIVGVIGAFFASIVLAPALIYIFAGSGGVNPISLVVLMVQLVAIPFLISRLLRWSKILQKVERVRGGIIDWSFAFLIFVAVGLNREVFFSNPSVLLAVSAVLIAATFVLGMVYQYFYERIYQNRPMAISQNLLATIKSSGFSVFTSISLFGQESAVPSAVLAVIVLVYLLFLSLREELKRKAS